MTTPRRRWIAFSLRTLFVVVTVLACWLGWQVGIVRERKAVRRWLDESGYHTNRFLNPDATDGMLFKAEKISFFRRMLGDEPVDIIYLFSPRNPTHEDYDRLHSAFPDTILVPDCWNPLSDLQ